jgi:hypothetical protein
MTNNPSLVPVFNGGSSWEIQPLSNGGNLCQVVREIPGNTSGINLGNLGMQCVNSVTGFVSCGGINSYAIPNRHIITYPDLGVMVPVAGTYSDSDTSDVDATDNESSR